MEVVRATVDKDFDRYVLSMEGIKKTFLTLDQPVLKPLDPVQTVRKAQWDARVHQNALINDPFLSIEKKKDVAYFVDEERRLMQVVHTDVSLHLCSVSFF